MSLSGNMTENKSTELEDEFIEYFEVTKFKTQQISAEIVADFTKCFSTEDCFFLAGSFEVVSFEAGSFESFPCEQIDLDEVLTILRY